VSGPDESANPAWAALDSAFEAAMRGWREGTDPFTLLFSGGVDSGLLAWELRDHPGLELLAIGTAGAADLTDARESAGRLGLRPRIVEVEPSEVGEAEARWAPLLEGVSAVHRSVLVAFAIALGHAAPGRVMCGQGVDELFLGYAHFRGLDPSQADARSRADLRTLLEEDGPRVDRIAADLGRTLASPYLAPEFVRAAHALPISVRMPYDRPKDVFRRWAAYRGLPFEVADRPKRAMQYGSGIARLMNRGESRSPPESGVAH
jgi:asparagine synthase (glutamine-hydrolysing)